MSQRPALLLALGVLAMSTPAHVSAAQNPRELGLVRWGRSLDAARAESRRTGRPVLLLFQEIPGCKTCVDFGQGPLSNPLLVEAIESEFIPVAIYNNRAGADAELLASFGEAACNNPVLRLQDAAGRDLLPRREGIWDAHGVAGRLIAALEAAKRPVPGYLKIAYEESAATGLESATFAMHCYWEGEAALGALDGVVATRAGSLEGLETVDLSFDPALISYSELVRKASGLRCASRVFARSGEQLREAGRVVGERAVRSDEPARDAAASDQKYYLQHSPLQSLPLTPLQATRVNAALAAGEDPAQWLSPRQRTLAARAPKARP